jgi:hypothetical protein
MLGILFIGLSELSKPELDPVEMVKAYRESFTSYLTKFTIHNPSDHDTRLLSLSPIRISDRKARLQMIEPHDINSVLSDLKSGVMDVELLSERIVSARQPIYRETSVGVGGVLRKLYSHQHEALDVLASGQNIKALVMRTSTSSGKSLVYQVS